MAFAIFLVEKEFNVGPITSEFPMLKFFNLIDEKNSKRYAESVKKGTKGGTTTFG